MPSAYVDMQLSTPPPPPKKHAKPKNNSQKQNQNQFPQLGQVTDLVYCVAAQTADLARHKNGNKQLGLTTEWEPRVLASTSDLMF